MSGQQHSAVLKLGISEAKNVGYCVFNVLDTSGAKLDKNIRTITSVRQLALMQISHICEAEDLIVNACECQNGRIAHLLVESLKPCCPLTT
jgi:hypothetical protein